MGSRLIILINYLFIFWDRVSLCDPSWTRTHYLSQASFKLVLNIFSLAPEHWYRKANLIVITFK